MFLGPLTARRAKASLQRVCAYRHVDWVLPSAPLVAGTTELQPAVVRLPGPRFWTAGRQSIARPLMACS